MVNALRHSLPAFCLFLVSLLLAIAVLPVPAAAQKAADFYSKGYIRTGPTTDTCNSSTQGGMRWNNSTDVIEMCNGSSWSAFASNPASGCTGPSAFSFTNATNQTVSTVIYSNTITPTGCSAPNLSVFVSGSGSPQVSINGGAWATSGVWNSGNTVAVRLTSSGSASTTLSAVVQIGSTSGTAWTVTTVGGGTQIFMTANSYSPNFGGLTGADAVCMSEANTFGYSGTWKAVLSTSSVNASSRLTISYPVVLASSPGTVIAASNLWNTLTGAITGGFHYPWTGSNSDGTFSGYSCNDWTTASGSDYVMVGAPSYNNQWLSYTQLQCNYVYYGTPIYCVSQ